MAKFATSVDGVEEILRGFTRLSKGVQRKYLGSSVREVVKGAMPEVKALTPKGPTGNLRRSVGLKLEKKKTTTAVGLVGYRTGGKTNRELGYHAYWSEQGVKDRYAKNGSALKIPMRYARKYNYLKGKMAASQQAAADLGGADGGAIFFRSVRGYTGSGKFQRWAEQNLPRLKEQLVGKLEANLSKAIAEEERRMIRRKYGKK
jgi:hypothetical protein